ncbi:hypothetical protein GALL_414260 [mine drainage metagenome]|uniref:Uncharacterized protein n=1 Tax=mine drainage metagenome TaxID=410659 RepID=A0A1J5QH87_9ZZZZ
MSVRFRRLSLPGRIVVPQKRPTLRSSTTRFAALESIMIVLSRMPVHQHLRTAMHRISDCGSHQRFTVPRMEHGDDSCGPNHRAARPAGAGKLRVARRANRFDLFRRCFAPKLARPQKSLSRNLQFAQRFKVIWVVVQSRPQKYFALPQPQITSIFRAILPRKRGASRSSRTLGAGCGGRGSGARRAALIRLPQSFDGLVPKPSSKLLRKACADGEVVWS